MPAAFSPRQAFSDSLKKVLVLYFINLFEPFELTHPNIVFTPFHLGKHLPAHGQAHDLELGSHLLLGQTLSRSRRRFSPIERSCLIFNLQSPSFWNGFLPS